MSHAISNLEEGVSVKYGVAGSEDRLPSLVIDGANANDAYILTGADNSLQDLTYEVIAAPVSENATFDITATGDDIVVTLGATGMVKASIVIHSDTSDNTGVLTLTAITGGSAGNGAAGGLKVVITNPGPDDCALATSMGGTGNNTLTIALGRTGNSTASTKNAVSALVTAINAIATNKKIDAAGSGTQSKQVTLTATSANFASGANSSLTAITAAALVAAISDSVTWPTMAGVATAALFTRDKDGDVVNTGAGAAAVAVPLTPFVDTNLTGVAVNAAGFSEVLIIVALGVFEPEAALDIVIEDSPDGVTFTPVDGAVFGTYDYTDANSVKTGVLRLVVAKTAKYLHAISTVTGLWVEHSVVFVLSPQQYSEPSTTTHEFLI